MIYATTDIALYVETNAFYKKKKHYPQIGQCSSSDTLVQLAAILQAL